MAEKIRLGPHLLGRFPSPYDPRDWVLEDFMPRLRLARKRRAIPTSRRWDSPYGPFNQGIMNDKPVPDSKAGHCGGFEALDWRARNPITGQYLNDDGHDYYYGIVKLAGLPGDEGGIAMRWLAEYIVAMGWANGYAFSASLATAKEFVLADGSLGAGTIWTYDMFEPDAYGRIFATGAIAGGHAWGIIGYQSGGYSYEIGWLGVTQWGDFGIKHDGVFLVPDTEMVKLFRQQGEIVAALEIEVEPKPDPVPPEPVPPSGGGCGERFEYLRRATLPRRYW